ncbi:acetylcholinesterase-like [Ruditapes philippinarum]|uniref:acetylcholinesterase-like n=1 Tax=Ruditapes philippinarum TaxID=129788 RepID=UPI00295AC49E|nr:acetylcholinesterase-like [Ruditapes philippinarum]
MWSLQTTVILTCVSFCITQTPVYVDTKVGRIMGFQEHITLDREQKSISKFLGIPFAESTGGQNRFRKPVPKAPFNGTFDASKDAVACYQQSEQMNAQYKSYGVSGFSEDCLTLNIYVPNELRANDLRPVMIWVYGGGFVQGASTAYKPEALALFGNVIVVTINYRIGMLGFLRDPNGVFPGNQGLWDQQLAFKWVHDHIDSFFGYKDEITIFGQSAGAGSVMLQALYPGNEGLFKRVIAESGSALAPWSIYKASIYDGYIREQGCDPTSKTLVTCLQSRTLISLQSNMTSIGPVVDGDLLVASPIEIMTGTSTKTARARNFFASLDIIIGCNDKEGAGYFFLYQYALNHSNLNFNISLDEFRNTVVPINIDQTFSKEDNDTKVALKKLLTFSYTDWNDPNNYVSLRQNAMDIPSDAIMFSPASITVQAHARLNVGKVYLYEFAVQTKTHYVPVSSWLKGSNHGDDLQFVFGLPLRENISMIGISDYNFSPEQKQVARAMMAMWSNFARSGNPNLPMDITKFTNTTWPAYDMTSQRYFRISDQMSPASIIEKFYPRRMALWSDLIPEIRRQHCPIKNQPDIFHFDPSTELVG